MPKRAYRIFKQLLNTKWFFPILLFIGYFLLYFFLRDSFLFTPDFGGTDVFHFNISYKYHLWQSIRNGVIPFWTDKLDGGFPLIAESQVGTLFLPYYLIFPVFSNFSHANSFLFSFHLFLLSMGMYLLLKELKIPSFLSFLLTIIFAWNGSITFRWVHFIVLQSFSFVPLLFLIYMKWNKKQKFIYLFFIAFTINQMIFAGFIQVVFISLLGLVFLHIILNFPFNRNKTILLACSVVFGILLSLPQILPTLQFSQFTTRTLSTNYDFAVSIPFTTRNLCAFFSADCLGTAHNATYSTNFFNDGVYWENTPYLGPFFVIVLILSSIALFTFRKKEKEIGVYLGLFFLFLLLALGKNSPLYFVFSIFPFSMFRTPPRYLLLSVFFLILYSAVLLKKIIQEKIFFSIFVYVALILNCILLVSTAFRYHLFVKSSTVYASLTTQKKIKYDSLYLTYGSSDTWNAIFSKAGWSTKKNISDFLFINRALLPNTNLITGQSSFNIYASLEMRRQQYIKSVLYDELDAATNASIEATVSAKVENMLELYNIGSIISLKKIFLPHYKETQIMKNGNITVITYQRTEDFSPDHYYIPKEIKKVGSMEEIQEMLVTNTVTRNRSIGELIPRSLVQNSLDTKLSIQKDIDGHISGTSTSRENTFAVLNKNWYPEWRLYIDGKEQSMYKTNIIHIGFFVPKGKHTFELKYIPTSFYLGCVIALLAAIGAIGVVLLLKAIKRGK